MTEEQVKNDVHPRRAADEAVRHRRSGGGARALPHLGRRGLDHRRQSLDRRRLDRAVMNILSRALCAVRRLRPPTARSASISRCRAAARTARSPGACSMNCSPTGGIEIEGMSGTSAGAINAVMVADGLARGGPRGSAQAPRRFLARGEPRRRHVDAQPRHLRPAVLADPDRRRADAGRGSTPCRSYLSPYDLNPLNINPLKDLIVRFVDFDAVQKSEMPLFIAATNVHTGRLRVFPRDKIDADAVMASAALPLRVPRGRDRRRALLGRRLHRQPADLSVLPHHRDRGRAGGADQSGAAASTPKSSQEIINRINEITFNASLISEYRAIEFVRRLIDEGALKHGTGPGEYRRINVHRVDLGLRRQEADAGEPAQHRL